MDTPPQGPNLLTVALALCSALFASLSGILTWSARRQVARADSHGERLRELETDRVTKGDITAVYERIEKLSEQSHEQHVAVLRTLIDRRP